MFKHLWCLFLYPMISSWYMGTTLILICCLFLLLSYHLPKQLKPLMLPWQPWWSQWFSWADVAGLPLLSLLIVSLPVIHPSIPLSSSAFLCSPLPLNQLLKVLWWTYWPTVAKCLFFSHTFVQLLRICWMSWAECGLYARCFGLFQQSNWQTTTTKQYSFEEGRTTF